MNQIFTDHNSISSLDSAAVTKATITVVSSIFPPSYLTPHYLAFSLNGVFPVFLLAFSTAILANRLADYLKLFVYILFDMILEIY